MAKARTITRTIDNNGRLTIGRQYANRTVVIKQLNESEFLVTLARVIPEHEAWLFRNEKAQKLVAKGLTEAREGRFSSSPPDLDEDIQLVEQLEDD